MRRRDGTGTAHARRRPDPPRHAVLHLRPRRRRAPSAVVHGPFTTQGDALAAAGRLRRTSPTADGIELLDHACPWLGGSHAEHSERVEELLRRLLRRIHEFPGDFDPRAATARRPPGALFALACMEAPRAARELAETLQRALPRGTAPAPAMLGQVLLDAPHEAAMLLHRVRWPAHWFGGRGRAGPDALRPADATTACAVLARRLRRGRWPAREARLAHRIPEDLYRRP